MALQKMQTESEVTQAKQNANIGFIKIPQSERRTKMQTKRNRLKGKIAWKPEYAYDREHDDHSMSVTKAIAFQYEELGNAIILGAMDDYADAVRKGDKQTEEDKEFFFRHSFCNDICSMGPERLMNLAMKKPRETKRRYERK